MIGLLVEKHRSGLLGGGALVAGIVLLAGLAGGPGWAPAASAAAGGLLALLIAAGSSVASSRAVSRGPVASLKVSIGGVLVRMVLVGAGVGVAATRSWFRPLPFVASFGIFFFATGFWLVLAERKALRAGAGAPSGSGGNSRSECTS